MKMTINTFLLTIPLIAFLGCSQEKNKDAKEILTEMVVQNEIIELIINDKEMMTNLMSHMVASVPAMRLLKENYEIVKHMPCSIEMMKSDTAMARSTMANMFELMESDTTACNMMESMIMENEHMMSMMKEIMHKKGMVIKDNNNIKMHHHY